MLAARPSRAQPPNSLVASCALGAGPSYQRGAERRRTTRPSARSSSTIDLKSVQTHRHHRGGAGVAARDRRARGARGGRGEGAGGRGRGAVARAEARGWARGGAGLAAGWGRRRGGARAGRRGACGAATGLVGARENECVCRRVLAKPPTSRSRVTGCARRRSLVGTVIKSYDIGLSEMVRAAARLARRPSWHRLENAVLGMY